MSSEEIVKVKSEPKDPQTATKIANELGKEPALVRVQSLLKFGEQYKASQIKQFEDYYIDYDGLKTILHDLFSTGQQKPISEKRASFFSSLILEITGADNFHAEKLRKYYDQHMEVLLPEKYETWKSKQMERRASFKKAENERMLESDEEKKAEQKEMKETAEMPKISETTEIEAITLKTTETTETTKTTEITETVTQSKETPTKATKGPSLKITTAGKISIAIRALSRLLIFWKQNQLAISNIILKYEAYSKEQVQRYLTIGAKEDTSSFVLPMHPKVKRDPLAEPKLVERVTSDPKEEEKFNQDLQRLSHATQRFEKRKKMTETEIGQLNELLHHLAEREPMTSSEVDLSTFFVEEPVATVKELPIDACEPGTITRLWLEVVDDPLTSIKVPVIICKGTVKGPIVGITAALHGNEVNGVSVIHRLLRGISVEELTGVIVAIPCANPPGFIHRTRHFICGQETKDLNKCFPGKPDGEGASQFVYCLTQKLVKKITHLIDLHTASHGRQNSLYARADMNHAVCKQMAILQTPQIILHSTAPDGSLREAAMKLGKPAITVEIGNPSSFQKAYISHALQGVQNVLSFLGMIHDTVEPPLLMPTICVKSKWSFAEHGGTLQMMVEINQWLKKGDVVAIGRNIFGDMIKQYEAVEDGIVIGRNIDPTCEMGDRLIHFGTVGPSFPAYNNPFRDGPDGASQQG